MEHLNIDNIIAEIDAELNRPPISIEAALQEAVRAGRMTIKESQECLEAYERTLGQALDPKD